LATRIHFRYVVQDSLGSVIQNAKVFVYQPGTTTGFTGTAYNAKSGGSSISNGFVTNSQGEAEAWFDTPQSVDIAITDNSGAAYYPAAPSTLVPFTTITEANWDLEPAREDLPASIGVVGDIVAITAASQTALAGATGRWTDAGHRHANPALSANPHGIADHTDVTRSISLRPQDATLDTATLLEAGSTPNELQGINCADAATQGAYWQFVTPSDYASGTLSATIYWSPSVTVASSAVRFSLTARDIAAAADVTTAGTTVDFTGSSETHTTPLLYKEAVTDTTVTPAAGDLIRLEVRRIGGDALDTLTASVVRIHLVLITYTASQ